MGILLNIGNLETFHENSNNVVFFKYLNCFQTWIEWNISCWYYFIVVVHRNSRSDVVLDPAFWNELRKNWTEVLEPSEGQPEALLDQLDHHDQYDPNDGPDDSHYMRYTLLHTWLTGSATHVMNWTFQGQPDSSILYRTGECKHLLHAHTASLLALWGAPKYHKALYTVSSAEYIANI